MQKITVLILTLIVLFASCKKESDGYNCERLKDGITTNNVDIVKTQVNNAISQLQSNDHTAGNLSSLVTILSQGCGVTAEFLCFSCIYTYPPQSEIKVSFNSAGNTLSKVIDITHSSSISMVFRSMHD